jgi:hypothetical protein
MRLYLVDGDGKSGLVSTCHVRLRWLFLPHAIDPPACGAHAILQIKVSPGPIGGRKYRSLLIFPQRDLLIVVEGVGPGNTNRIEQGCALSIYDL